MSRGTVIIPARMSSSRLPGKPLKMIGSQTMIEHVYRRCAEGVGPNSVHIATDSLDIKKACEDFGANVVMTSEKCLTGTDRIAEANRSLNFDFVVNVQGDEPLTKPEDVRLVFDKMANDSSNIVNCYAILTKEEGESPTVPKVVVSNSGRLMYMSRGGIPFTKHGAIRPAFKQVCIYGFSRSHLELFTQQAHKTKNESIEDIEILRFLELDEKVQMLLVEGGGIAVDTPDDLERARNVMYNQSR